MKQVPYMPVCDMDLTPSKKNHSLLLNNELVPSDSRTDVAAGGTRNNVPKPSIEEQQAILKNIWNCNSEPPVLSLLTTPNTFPKKLLIYFNLQLINCLKVNAWNFVMMN
jgi:hypothetical protein